MSNDAYDITLFDSIVEMMEKPIFVFINFETPLYFCIFVHQEGKKMLEKSKETNYFGLE
jgi:hypothetical protein